MKFYIFFFFPKLASNKHQSLQYQALCWILESDMKDKTLAWINIFFKKLYLFTCLHQVLVVAHKIISCSMQI